MRFFAYGTLQIQDVMQAVTGSEFPSEPARLAGFARYCIAGRPYPGICPEPGAETEGLLFAGLNPEHLQRLDDFEDDFYRREGLLVTTAGGYRVEAEVYVVAPEFRDILLSLPWSLDDFRRQSLHDFLSRIAATPAPSIPVPRG